MAWVTPVTDRTDGSAMMTASDMNRITGDVEYLQDNLLGAVTISQTSWTINDIITSTFWTELLTAITALGTHTGATLETMSSLMTYDNINAVESNLAMLYNETATLTDFTAYGTSIVDEETYSADLDDSTLIDSATSTAWNEIV